jgi:SAM-dependent methyltransferase
MEARHQRLIQRRGWDRAVRHYERHWARQLRPVHDLLLRRAALVAGEHVIDVACGTGLVTLAAATAVAGDHGADRRELGGCATATDLSPAMVATVETSARLAGLGNVRAVVCGAEELTVDGPFDVALCSLGLMYLPDPARALTEMHRVLRPGGRIVASVWGERRHCGWAELFGIVDSRVTSDVCPMFFALGGPEVLATQLQLAGFVDVDHERLSIDLDYADDADAVGAAFLGGPVALAHAHFDLVTKREAEHEYLHTLREFRTSAGGYRVPAEFVVASGSKPA